MHRTAHGSDSLVAQLTVSADHRASKMIEYLQRQRKFAGYLKRQRSLNLAPALVKRLEKEAKVVPAE